MQKHINKKNVMYAGLALGAAFTAGTLLYSICKRIKKRRETKPKYLKNKSTEFVSDPLKTANVDLNVQEAKLRGSLISDVKYLLGLHLKKDGAGIEGYLRIDFSLNTKGNGIFLDYDGDYVKWVSINGKYIPPEKIFAHKRIGILMEYQKTGRNSVEIYYKTGYSKDGKGLHYFKDTEDGAEYLYTHFESFFAHRMFPCFDQPDLKATLTLLTLAPSEWEIIGNENETDMMQLSQPIDEIQNLLQITGIPRELLESVKDQRAPTQRYTLHVFRETPKISTYILGLIAGPYAKFTKNTDGYPPMRIFCRKSLVHYIEKYTDDFFYLTQKGIDFYKEYFGFEEFHFSKYDQIYCPEFNIGAMENVGCITYSEEKFLWKTPPTELERNYLAIVILHELSHMWFGNMVTMIWWNDLWLKEAFATLMSHLCLAEGKGLEKYTKSWVVFHRYQQWGYVQDELPTTHCISSNCQNTAEGEAAFDGITYAKGSSVLRQLLYLIGADVFKLGVQRYFQRYAWGNTQLIDFIQCLQEAVNEQGEYINLKEWSDIWLNTSGLNQLKPTYDIRDNKITNFKIEQSTCDFGDSNLCRVFKTDLALFDKNMETPPEIIKGIKILGADNTSLNELEGKKAPSMVLLNTGGYSFAKIKADDEGVQFLKANILGVKDDLDRLQCWKIFRDMVNDAEISAPEFIQMLSNAITTEEDSDCLLTNIQYVISTGMAYVPDSHKEEYMHMLFTHLLTRISKDNNPNTQKVLLQELPSFIHSESDLEIMKNWLESKAPNPIYKIAVDPILKYKLLVVIHASQHISSEEKGRILKEQLEMDKSYEAMICRKQCFGASPIKENKDALWNWFVDVKSTDSNKMRLAAMKVFWQMGQGNILEPYIPRYFMDVLNVYANINRIYANLFVTFLCPVIYTEKILEQYEDLYDMVPDNEMTFRSLVEKHIILTRRGIDATKLSIQFLKHQH